MTAAVEHPRNHVEAKLLVAGESVEGVEKRSVPSPADPGALVGCVHLATGEIVQEACEVARRVSADWAAMPVARRAQLLDDGADAVEAAIGDLTALLSAEHGKPLREARAEIDGAVGVLRWHAAQEDCLSTRTIRDGRGTQLRRRAPLGVVAVIVPWNYPVLLAQLMVAPALLAGNTIVLKLPDHAPLALSRALGLLADGLPAGVLNVLAGDGDTVGSALTTHPHVRKVAFTGSTQTGRSIMSAASASLKSLSLELGGNDAAIVLPDTTVDDELIDELIAGTLTNAGQICYAPKRLYVPVALADRFRRAFEAGARGLRTGRPDDEGTTTGPLNNAQQLSVVRELAEDARERGAELIPLGELDDGLPEGGHWFQPALVVGLPNDARLVQEEQFGPLVPVVAYHDLDEAIEMANDTEYGLAASVWADDADQAFEVAARLEAGTVFVNIHRVGASAVDMPFGGIKQSGIGRGHGIEGVHEYTELQVIAERRDMRGTRGT